MQARPASTSRVMQITRRIFLKTKMTNDHMHVEIKIQSFSTLNPHQTSMKLRILNQAAFLRIRNFKNISRDSRYT